MLARRSPSLTGSRHRQESWETVLATCRHGHFCQESGSSCRELALFCRETSHAPDIYVFAARGGSHGGARRALIPDIHRKICREFGFFLSGCSLTSRHSAPSLSGSRGFRALSPP